MLAVCLLTISACKPVAKTESGKEEASPAAVAAAAAKRNREFLQSILEVFDPVRVGVAAVPEDSLSLLNEWQRGAGTSSEADTAGVTQLAGRIFADQSDRDLMLNPSFTVADAYHLRDCRLAQRIAASLTSRTANDVDRLKELAAFVSRHMQLVKESPIGRPMSMFEAFYFAQGTAEDRAAAVVAIARELAIDPFILQVAKSADGGDSGSLLVALNLADKTYIYAPSLGLILREPGSGSPKKLPLATLIDLRKNDAWLRQYDVSAESPFPWTAELLAAAVPAVPGNAPLWSPRFVILQSQLIGDQRLVVSDPLQESATGPGALSRIATIAGNNVTAEQLTFWTYPQKQSRGLLERAPEHAAAIQSMNEMYNLQFFLGFERPHDDADLVARFDRSLQRGRLMLISGAYDDALTKLTESRISPLNPPARKTSENAPDKAAPKAAENSAALLLAKDAAEIWTAMGKYEQGEHRIAADTAERYLRNHPDGRWQVVARKLLAEARIELDKPLSAAKVLKGIPQNDPEYAGAAWVLKTIEQKAAEPTTSKTGEGKPPSSTPAEDASKAAGAPAASQDAAPEKSPTEPDAAGESKSTGEPAAADDESPAAENKPDGTAPEATEPAEVSPTSEAAPESGSNSDGGSAPGTEGSPEPTPSTAPGA